MALVDVVVVSFNSRATLRACVEPLANLDDVNVIVVDNASPDGSLEVVSDLPIRRIPLPSNAGFAHGCNAGIAGGEAPFVLLLNPDAEISAGSIHALARGLEEHPELGAVRSTDRRPRRAPRLFAAAVSAPPLDVRPSALPSPRLSTRALDGRARPRRAGLRAPELAGMGLGRLSPASTRRARATRRPRRRLLHVFRGRRPLQAAA